MIREKLWNKLQPLRAALDKVRSGPTPLDGLFQVPGETFSEEPRWEVIFRDGDRDAGTGVELATFATAAEIEDWYRHPDREIRGTGMSWRNTGSAKKKKRAA
ncbi:MAG: hypothetical protein ACLPYS_19210 [Vulcanimicrobiaceae bacterium]